MDRSGLKTARAAIKRIAERDGVSEEYVREQMRSAMLAGWNSSDPAVRAYWDSIPREGELPTPEELIAFAAERVRRRRGL